jgi:hypothetical protein
MPGKGLEPLRLQRRHLILSLMGFVPSRVRECLQGLSYAVYALRSCRLVPARCYRFR